MWASHAYPHTRAGTVLPLMLMHLAVAAICLLELPVLGRDTRAQRNAVDAERGLT